MPKGQLTIAPCDNRTHLENRCAKNAEQRANPASAHLATFKITDCKVEAVALEMQMPGTSSRCASRALALALARALGNSKRAARATRMQRTTHKPACRLVSQALLRAERT